MFVVGFTPLIQLGFSDDELDVWLHAIIRASGQLGQYPTNSSRDNRPRSCQLWRMKSSIWIYAVSALLLTGMTSVAEDKTDSKAVPKTEEKKSSTADLKDPSKLTEKAPDIFKVKFDTTKGAITIEVTRDWAPKGADRFYNLVKAGYFKDIAFFRVIPGFMAQFGIHGDPEISKVWSDANINDDPVKGSNKRGTITFATAGPNTRSTQFFINFGDNVNLDSSGFAPFGKVVEGMDVVDKINSEYGEGAPRGRGPRQDRIQGEGNAYLKKDFPNLDYIKSATILP
jgi:peptidyl-prolyl cis-trans isomerase A (cyclophilin A)